MISMLGLPLQQAMQILAAADYAVKVTKTSSRKGVPGGTLRIVREQAREGCIELTFASFLDDCTKKT